MSSTELATRPWQPVTCVPDDLCYVEQVVRAAFPIQDARTYLRRHLGNEVRFRLVEAVRGEGIGQVRAAEILPAGGGEPMLIQSARLLPDGTPAGGFAPEAVVHRGTELVLAPGASPFPLSPRDTVLLHVPVRGYMRYLPGIFQGEMQPVRRDLIEVDEVSQRRWGARDISHTTEVEVRDTDALRRFLFLFQHVMTTVVDRVDDLPSLTDPISADPRFLPWIASWVNFDVDASLPVHQQRELVRRAIRLYRNRGTKLGVEEMVRVLTSVPATVVERRPPPSFTLGQACLARGRDVVERFQSGEPSGAYLVAPARPATRYFVLLLETREQFTQRFGERAPEVLRRIARIATTEKPAHVTFTLRFEPLETSP
jgi:phage tail-like protein